MSFRNLYILCFIAFVTACSSGRKVVSERKVRTTIVEPTDKNLPSVQQNKHVKDLKKKTSTSLNKYTLEYIKKYAPLAVHEMHQYKIPASITLAQGILESGNGRSTLAKKSNNHFGIKCHKGWRGKRVYHDDDEKGECFRKYKYVISSYEDHSKFLRTRQRYASLFKLNRKDYRGWAKGLKKAGYATDRRYPQKLIKIIEEYKLYEFDDVSKKDVKKELVLRKEKFKKNEIKSKTNLKFYQVKKGDTLYSIAKKFNITIDDLKKINDLESNIISIGQKLQIK